MMASGLERKFIELCSAAGVVCPRNAEGLICFPAACTEVGDLTVYFDGHEITVDIENITHCHFTPYAAGATYPAVTEDDCARRATDFLLEVLGDRRVLWKYKNGAGGTYPAGGEEDRNANCPLPEEKSERFLWSGRHYDSK